MLSSDGENVRVIGMEPLCNLRRTGNLGLVEIFIISDLKILGFAAEDTMGFLVSLGLMQSRMRFGRICDSDLILIEYPESISFSSSDWLE